MVKPAEIGNIEFSTSFRGYNPDQVDDYVDNVVKQYTEAYNAGAELERLCKAQKARIAELEAKIASAGSKPAEQSCAPAAPQKPAISDEEIEKSRMAFEEYKAKAEELKETIKEYKTKIVELYQSHISELQKLNIDDIKIPDLPEASDKAESSAPEIISYENSVEAKNSEKIAHLVSELGDIGTNGEPYEDDTDVSSLIDDISDILNAGIEEVEVNNEGSGEKDDVKTEDAAYSNPFNQMFITEDIG